MSDKQIFASLEISDHEIRLVIGEFFNTRFNIIKVERVSVNAFTAEGAINTDAIVSGIRTAVEDAEKMIGASLEKVILAIPSRNMKRYSVKVTVPIRGIDGEITAGDIIQAQNNAQTLNIDKNLALIQTQCIKYWVNGISSRRIPIGEKASELTIDIDLLCADRDTAYELVGCVESSGLQVMDIFLDIFAIGDEAALFEQSMDRNIVILKVERTGTTLGLISKGRLIQCIEIPTGVGSFAEAVVDQYALHREYAVELIKYSARLNEKGTLSNPVHLWQDGEETRKITERELCDCIRPRVDEWVDEMEKLCSGILQAGRTTVIITGEGGEMQGLSDLLKRKLDCEVRSYIPETLGGRNAGLSTCLGLFYAYKDKLPISGYADSSLDLEAFLNAVSYRSKDKKEVNQEDTLTKKIKGIFNGKR